MDQFLVPSSLPRNPKPPKHRIGWNRCIAELEGHLSPQYRHRTSQLLLRSYSQTGIFAHNPGNGESFCPTNDYYRETEISKGVTALEFDNKGIYVASVTSSGCLSVHDFETLYCSIYGPSSSTDKRTMEPVIHIPTAMPLNAIRWNPSNQDEVACASRQKDEIFVYDISYVSSDPEVLQKGTSRLYGLTGALQGGFSDIVYPSEDKSRLLASSLNGGIYMWDRRSSTTHCLELSTKLSECQFNTLELYRENRVVFGAGKNGVIYGWDLRGGRSSFAFQNPSEVPILTSMRVSSMLEKIEALKEQSNIVTKEIHSIRFDPSCSYQLAFHLDDGWSGVININDEAVTHVHCPPPNWNGRLHTWADIKRPAWLPTLSVYAVGSWSFDGIYLLDFYPDKTSPSHIYFNDDEIENISKDVPFGSGDDTNKISKKEMLIQNRLIGTTEDVLSCAIHPFNGAIVAGTKVCSLLVASQKPNLGENHAGSSAISCWEISDHSLSNEE